MREKKEKLNIYPFEEIDTFAGYSGWDDDTEQDRYLEKVSSQIGWIIIEFNRLEWQVHEVVKKYLCNDVLETNAIFFETVANKNFSSKIDLLKNFFTIYYSGDKKQMFDETTFFSNFKCVLDKLIDKLKKSSTLRNKYAHCYWHRMSKDNFVEFKYKINHEEGLHKVFVSFNPNDLNSDYELIESSQELLYEFDTEFNDIYSST